MDQANIIFYIENYVCFIYSLCLVISVMVICEHIKIQYPKNVIQLVCKQALFVVVFAPLIPLIYIIWFLYFVFSDRVNQMFLHEFFDYQIEKKINEYQTTK